MNRNHYNLFEFDEHTHAKSIKIKGPFLMLSIGHDAAIESDPADKYYVVKMHLHEMPDASPKKIEIIVPASDLGEVISRFSQIQLF